MLTRLPIRIDPGPSDATAILAAGRRHQLSAHDAAYFILAERLGVPLATLDTKLAAACAAAGVALIA